MNVVEEQAIVACRCGHIKMDGRRRTIVVACHPLKSMLLLIWLVSEGSRSSDAGRTFRWAEISFCLFPLTEAYAGFSKTSPVSSLRLSCPARRSVKSQRVRRFGLVVTERGSGRHAKAGRYHFQPHARPLASIRKDLARMYGRPYQWRSCPPQAAARVVIHGEGHRGHAAAARSSLSAPRMTILSASSGSGRCSACLSLIPRCAHPVFPRFLSPSASAQILLSRPATCLRDL